MITRWTWEGALRREIVFFSMGKFASIERKLNAQEGLRRRFSIKQDRRGVIESWLRVHEPGQEGTKKNLSNIP